MKEYFKFINELATYALFLVFIALMRLIGIENASNFGSWVFRIIGPRTKPGKIVRNNLAFVYDDISPEKVRALEEKIWDNFGRYIGEFAFIDENHLKHSKRVKVTGSHIIDKLKKDGRKYIIFSGHFANWDYILYEVLKLLGEAGVVYRKVNNRFIDSYVLRHRSMPGAHLVKKGADGGREIVRLIKRGANLMMLVDQKMNEGIRIPLLNKPANTATGVASLARQFNYAIVPAKIERVNVGGSCVHFHITLYESFEVIRTDSKENDIYNTTVKINDMLSSFIAARPDQWLWQHQRWGKPSEMKSE